MILVDGLLCDFSRIKADLSLTVSGRPIIINIHHPWQKATFVTMAIRQQPPLLPSRRIAWREKVYIYAKLYVYLACVFIYLLFSHVREGVNKKTHNSCGHVRSVRNILHLFSKKKINKKISCGQVVDPPPPFVDMSLSTTISNGFSFIDAFPTPFKHININMKRTLFM